MKVNILGTEYKIKRKKYNECLEFKENGWGAFCNEYDKEIIIGILDSFPNTESDSREALKKVEEQCLRHEIIHAFLNESGLSDNTHYGNCGWAKNEEMVDWIAIQFPKIVKVFQKLGCL